MSTHKYFDRICVAVILLSLFITVLFMNVEALGLQAAADEDAETYSGAVRFTANDQDGAWDTSNATIVTLEGTSARVSGSGAYAYDGNVYITGGGWYVFSGSLTDGSIVVDAYSSSKVWILLNGVKISCSDDACLRVDQAEKVFLTLAEGTENAFSSGAEYSAEALADGTDGAIYAHDDLTINGGGSLAITSLFKHGIAAKDDLVVTGGTLTITAARDAINANDSVRIKGAAITVSAEDDGVAVTGEAGYFYMESGSMEIVCGDDAVHTASDAVIVGGALYICAGDDAIHSDTSVVISDGTIHISECFEGLEAPAIEISGGDIAVYPSDDGFNATSGSGEMGGMRNRGASGEASGGSDEASDVEEETLPHILVSGGNITIINEAALNADGMDSNGDVFISGGTIRISLPDSDANTAIDFGSENGGVCEISGGTVVACGGHTMAERFSSSSTQCSLLYEFNESVEAETTVSVADTTGKVLLSWDVPFSFSSVVMSCPEMVLGGDYLVAIGENTEEIRLGEISSSFGDTRNFGASGEMSMPRSKRTNTSESSGEAISTGGEQSTSIASGEQTLASSEVSGVTVSASTEQNKLNTLGVQSAASTETSGETVDVSAEQSSLNASGEQNGASIETTADQSVEDDAQNAASGEINQERNDSASDNRERRPHASDEMAETAESEETTIRADTWILICVSALTLLIGIIVAAKYRH